MKSLAHEILHQFKLIRRPVSDNELVLAYYLVVIIIMPTKPVLMK